MRNIHLVVEGQSDALIMTSIFNYLKLPIYGEAKILNGKRNILKRLPDYNRSAKHHYWVVLIDLDDDSQCVVTYHQQLLSNPSSNMIFRIAVKAIEAWLLADTENIARFLEIPLSKVPTHPEILDNPKDTLIALARLSKNKAIRDDIVPYSGSSSKIGIGYVTRIQEFLTHPEYPWRPHIAEQHSDSLRRCIRAIKNIKLT